MSHLQTLACHTPRRSKDASNLLSFVMSSVLVIVLVAGSVTRNNGGLNVAVAVQHVAEHLLEARERRFTGDVVGGTDFLLRNQAKSPAYGFRRVMERRLQSEFGVKQTI